MLVFIGINSQHGHGWSAVARWGYLPEQAIYRGAYWGLVTSAFVHVEPIHLLFNLAWLWTLGGALERAIGHWRWFLFVLASAFVSSGLQLLSGDAGIGMSGVVYAMFGFGWLARVRYPGLMAIVNARTVQLFIGWGVLCVFLTYAHIMNIGNWAHAGGCAFGSAIGGLVVMPRLRPLLAAAVVALTAASIVPLYWNPLSVDWVSMQAYSAFARHDYKRAIPLYRRSLDLGANPAWVWYSLTLMYAELGQQQEYEAALAQLQKVDPDGAKEIIDAERGPAQDETAPTDSDTIHRKDPAPKK